MTNLKNLKKLKISNNRRCGRVRVGMGRAQRKYYKGNGNKIMEVREFVLCFKGCLTFNQKTNIRKFIFCLNVKDGFEKRI